MKQNKMMMALVLSAGLLMSACGSKETKDAAADTPATEKVINTTHAYICPMNCENSASNEPGQCKVCGMDLVKNPNYAGAVADSTSTMVTDSAATGEPVKEEAKTEGHDHENHEGHNH